MMVNLLKNCVRTLWQEKQMHRINRRVGLQMRRIWAVAWVVAWAVVEWVVKEEAVDIDLLKVTLTKEIQTWEIQIWEIQICQDLQT